MTLTVVRTNQFVADGAGGSTITFTTASSLGAGGAPAVGNIVVVVLTSFNDSAINTPAGFNPDRSIPHAGSHTSDFFASRIIDGTEAATYQWTGLGPSSNSAVAIELHSTDGANWHADTGASDAVGGTGTSRAIGTSAILAAIDEAVIAAASFTSAVGGWSVTGGPTFTEINGAGSKFDHFAVAVNSGTSALTLTSNWSGSHTVDTQGFQTYYVTPPVTATPSAVPMTLTEPAPTVQVDTPVTPSAVPMTLALPAPTPAADGAPTPAAVPLVLALPTPDILSGVPVDALPLAMSLLLPTPSIAFDQTAFPSAVPMALALPAPSILVTVPVFPAPVPLAFTFPDPDVESRFGPVPVFALGRAPSTTPADRYPEPPYDPDRDAPPVQYRDGAVTYDPSP